MGGVRVGGEHRHDAWAQSKRRGRGGQRTCHAAYAHAAEDATRTGGQQRSPGGRSDSLGARFVKLADVDGALHSVRGSVEAAEAVAAHAKQVVDDVQVAGELGENHGAVALRLQPDEQAIKDFEEREMSKQKYR